MKVRLLVKKVYKCIRRDFSHPQEKCSYTKESKKRSIVYLFILHNITDL